LLINGNERPGYLIINPRHQILGGLDPRWARSPLVTRQRAELDRGAVGGVGTLLRQSCVVPRHLVRVGVRVRVVELGIGVRLRSRLG
jgi:hypothetical protein